MNQLYKIFLRLKKIDGVHPNFVVNMTKDNKELYLTIAKNGINFVVNKTTTGFTFKNNDGSVFKDISGTYPDFIKFFTENYL